MIFIEFILHVLYYLNIMSVFQDCYYLLNISWDSVIITVYFLTFSSEYCNNFPLLKFMRFLSAQFSSLSKSRPP